jgi:hypothetical protein
VLSVCERHFAQLQHDLPNGGIWVIKQYGPDAFDAEQQDQDRAHG